MKVLHVVASINRDTGGPAASVSGLATSMAAFGVTTTVATLDYAEHGPQMFLGGANLDSAPAGALTRALRGWNPSLEQRIAVLAGMGTDVVHNHGLWMFPNLYARRAASAAQIRLVISPRGMLDDWSLRRSRVWKAMVWRLFERRNLECADMFHATSEQEAQSIRAAGFRQPIACIPNGIALPTSPSSAGRSVLEATHPALRGKRWILFMSRLHPVKQLPYLLRAWSEVQHAYPDWHLLVAGDSMDGYAAEMRRLAADLGLGSRATFTGALFDAEKASAFANAGLLVLPTRSENFGIVVAEALAHGTPVLTTKAAPWGELETHRCGWWVDTDEAAVREGLKRALALPMEELRAMGARGRALVGARYAWSGAAREMLGAYLWASGKGERPACVSA